MKQLKINTIPYGTLIIMTLCLEFILCIVLAIILLPKLESIALFSFSLIFLIAIIHYIIWGKYFNFIYLSKDSIRHRNEKYTWDMVFVTANFSFLPNTRALVCYLYFDNHYLTQQECQSKEIRKKGFYITVKPKRLELLLNFYHKKIKLLNEPQFIQCKKMCDFIKNHNLEYDISD